MNPTTHAEISAKRRGGTVQEWVAYHSFMDSSKEVESSNLHRCLTHHLHFIRRVMIPVFGHTIHLSDGSRADCKDVGELDHVIEDYGGRFLPSLSDYVALIKDDPSDVDLVRQFDEEHGAFYEVYPEVREHIMGPLSHTGQLKGCLLTMNSWYLNHILPKVYPNVPLQIKDFGVKPSVLFNRLTYADWINNGRGAPPSFAKIVEHRKRKVSAAERAPRTRDVVFDGKRGGAPSEIVDGGRARTGPGHDDESEMPNVVLDGEGGQIDRLKALFDSAKGRVVYADAPADHFTEPPIAGILGADQVFIDGGAGPAGGCHPLPRKDAKPDHLVD